MSEKKLLPIFVLYFGMMIDEVGFSEVAELDGLGGQILIFSFCNLECFKCVYQNFKNRGAMLKIKPTLRLYFSQSFSMPFFPKCMKDSFHLFIIMTSLIATMH